MYNRIVNKTRYDNLGILMKQTSFTVKNLGENLSKNQLTIIKRSFRSNTKPLSLDSTIPVDDLSFFTNGIFKSTLKLFDLVK